MGDHGRSSKHHWAGLLATCTLLIAATGCTTGPFEWIGNDFKVGPNYGRPPAPVSESWIDGQSPELKMQSENYAYWWTVFNDPVLDDLVEGAYEQNLPLKIAGLRILEARAQLGVTRGNLFPQEQQAIGAYSRTEISEKSYPFGGFTLPKWHYDTWTVGFDAAWELDFWGRFRRAIEAADANLNAQIEDYDDVLVILQAEVAATYVEMRTLEERLSLARKNVELQKKTLRLTEDRFQAGTVSELDVQQARSILGATESLIPVLQAGHRKAQNRLCTLLGIPPRDLAAELGVTAKVPSAPPEVAVGIPAELLRRRPDIRRAERQAAVQCAKIGVAESELYPHIAITGTIAFEAEDVSELFDWRALTGAVGPGFRWNILNYGRIRNNIRVQDARFQQLVLKYQETVLRANEEVESSITAYLREQVRVKSLTMSTEATAKAVELADLQYEQGLVDFQRVLDSQRALVTQQDTLAQSRGNVARYLIAIYKALGGGWQTRFQLNRLPEIAPTNPPAEQQPTPAVPPPTPTALQPLPPTSKSVAITTP